MNLDNILNTVLSSESKVRILRLYTHHQGLELTKRELARMIGMSHTAVNAVISDLLSVGVLKVKYAGRSHIYTINKTSFLLPILAHLFKEERSIKENMLDTIREGMKSAGTSVLFGSYARGDEDLKSDIDLLIVTKDKEAAWKTVSKMQMRIQEGYGISISPMILTEAELKAKKNEPVYQNAINEGKLLAGKRIDRYVQ